LALQSAEALEKESISTRVIVVVEEHNIMGGLGEAVCGVVCERKSLVPVKRVGIRDEFCTIGPTRELWEYHGLNKSNIIKAAKEILE